MRLRRLSRRGRPPLQCQRQRLQQRARLRRRRGRSRCLPERPLRRASVSLPAHGKKMIANLEAYGVAHGVAQHCRCPVRLNQGCTCMPDPQQEPRALPLPKPQWALLTTTEDVALKLSAG